MRAVIVYESMFGSTRAIAEAIAEGLSPSEVRVVRAADADAAVLDGVDLLVVGGPTHALSMSRPGTRKNAPGYVRKPGSELVLEPGADTAAGVREWLSSLEHLNATAAAFDTRIKAPAALTGRASKAIARKLSSLGLLVVVPPESFLVDKKGHLLAGEPDRARAWAERLATISAGQPVKTRQQTVPDMADQGGGLR
jgi:hypothetical protein